MYARLFLRQLAAALLVFVIAATDWAHAQPAAEPFEPKVRQEGKDVIWVSTPHSMVNTMLDMAKVTAKDYVIDLGSGDGRTVIAAAKRGARALGIEYNADLVELSRRNAAAAGVRDKAKFVKADLFESDFSQATVITLFLLPEINLKLRPRILELKPGTRIVSNSFDMETWKADETVEVTEDCEKFCTALLWIVPAKVAGSWDLPQGTLTLKQTFQMVSGTLTLGTNSTLITNGRIRGNQITFRAGDAQYTGRVNGNLIQGVMKKNWTARKEP